MAAYAALVSLMNTIDQIQHHPRPPISLDKTQVEWLTERVSFLQDFFECYSHVPGYIKQADDLESDIADAAYAAEDIIESHVVDLIHGGSASQTDVIGSVDLYQGLNKVIENMDFIKKEVLEIMENMEIQGQQHRTSKPAGSRGLPSTGPSTMVEFGDILHEIMDKLIAGGPHRQTISIEGMGGIGKTTLARNIYEKQVIVQHFHILAWVTVSQEYSRREILVEILLSLQGKGSRESLSEMDDLELGDRLYKNLFGRTYLIILDDVWDVEVWDNIKFFFPIYNNGSRIMLTTRLSKLAFELSGYDNVFNMNFLDEDKSWNLFCKHVFGEEDCPFDELKEIGKQIVKSCKGLPLSISVIGGLLAKSEQTRQYWEHIAENLSSIVNLEDSESCLQILCMSYNTLPVQLKSCFLYMGMFPEDDEIEDFWVTKLWVAEGIIKPICGKSLEEVAKEYLQELNERNLILGKKGKIDGEIERFIIHDLLRDLCLREARKQKFFYVLREQSLNVAQDINTERRICLNPHRFEKEYHPQVLHALESASLVRTLLWYGNGDQFLPLSSSRLLRILMVQTNSLESIFQQVNLRMVSVNVNQYAIYDIPSSIGLLWNLQTLVVGPNGYIRCITAPSEIWKMTQLRRVMVSSLLLPDPLSGCTDGIVLENLEELEILHSFQFSEELVKRIPNIRKLCIIYYEFEDKGSPPNYCLNNISHLRKLEELVCLGNMQSHLEQKLTFPHSLKKLVLRGTNLHWEELTTNIGSLPHLQELNLNSGSFTGPRWETVEGQFPSLKVLKINNCDLKYWMTDSTHFPRLEHLVLKWLKNLKEIPSCIADIPTLQSINLDGCSDSANDSAERILEEQEELGNESLRVRVCSKGRMIVGEARQFQGAEVGEPMEEEELMQEGELMEEEEESMKEEKKAADLLGLEEDESKLGAGGSESGSGKDGSRKDKRKQIRGYSDEKKVADLSGSGEDESKLGAGLSGYSDEKKAADLLRLEEGKTNLGLGLFGWFHEKSWLLASQYQDAKVEELMEEEGEELMEQEELMLEDEESMKEPIYSHLARSSLASGGNTGANFQYDMNEEEIWDKDDPMYLKDFILFYSIFPTDYEFTKDTLIWQWIAGESIKLGDEMMEQVGVKCFYRLLYKDYIVESTYDHLVDQMKYKRGDKMIAFLQKQPLEPKFRKYLDSKQNDVAKVEHLSLACEEIDGAKFGVLKQCSHLQTLVIHRCYGSKVRHPPSDLFLELKVLKILNLSHTDIVVLPSSVENLKELRYLDISETPIGRLPEIICGFSNLQTLKLDGCLSLGGLPKSTSKLINLRHLVLDVVCQLQSMPTGIGKLSKLRTLSAFLVGEDDGCGIEELQYMNKLRGSFRILNLENVKTKRQAAEACLSDKEGITKIEFQWNDFQDKKNPREEEIFKYLRPPFGIEELKILFYSGGFLPYWICDPKLCGLVRIVLYKCRYCCSLPCLGKLRYLKYLSIVENNEVTEINRSFCTELPYMGWLGWTAFPKLERLSFDSMSKLEKWIDLEEGDCPSLRHLIIWYCPKFDGLPILSYMKSLLHVEISYCPELSSLPEDGLPLGLESLMIKDCPKLKDRCCNKQCEEWSKVAHVADFCIDGQQISP